MKKMIIALALLVVIGISSIVIAEPVEVVPPQNKVLGANNGRFVFGQISSLRRDQYMLDTQSGRLWQKVKDKDDSIMLQIVPYIHLDGSTSVVSENIQNAVVQILVKQEAEQRKKARKK